MARFYFDEMYPLIKPYNILEGLVRVTVIGLAFMGSMYHGARADPGYDASWSQVAESSPDRLRSTTRNTVMPVTVESHLVQPALPDRSGQLKIADEAIHILGGNLNVISQWSGDIRFVLVGSASESARQNALHALGEISMGIDRVLRSVTPDHLSAASYLNSLETMNDSGVYNCTLVGDSACANFVIVNSSVEMMRKIAAAIPLRDLYLNALSPEKDVVCFFSPVLGRGRVIAGGFVYVRKGISDAMTRTCLFEEIYQSFGVFNDYTNSEYFSFNNRIEPKHITFYDRALLRAVYDPEFTSGTPVFRVVNRLMENLGFDSFSK